MGLGKNLPLEQDKVIRNTSESIKETKGSISGKASKNPDKSTYGKVKQTYFTDPELIEEFNRYFRKHAFKSVDGKMIETKTDAFNIVFKKGLSQ